MSTLGEWVERLRTAVTQTPPAMRPAYRRLIAPGTEPLDLQGIVRVKGYQAISQMGHVPEAFSVIEWADLATNQAAPPFSELPNQIASLLTLATDRRIEILDELDTATQGSGNHVFIPIQQVPDRRLSSPLPETNVADVFVSYLEQLCSLDEPKQEALTEALSLHYGSVLLYDRDLAAAYTLVVAGLERLSRVFGAAPTEWQDWDQAASWDRFISNQQLTNSQAEHLRARLMRDRHQRLNETFANYVTKRLPETFWNEPWQEWMYPVDMATGVFRPPPNLLVDNLMKDHVTQDQETLRGAVRKSYDARSGFVHEGTRTIDFMSEIRGQIQETQQDRPLPFAVLRSMLMCMIKTELRACSSPYEMPVFELRHPPEEAV